ncbi:MAG: bifunctional hydroxymethylpyrimidine kinase/phosphomethylpyrimidine kinase [Calditerrivibrio sp.]|nr:bifunctional hydroxymethylpyrimidine kinase/phosphomethylpyrimidine kinase [Calditerrivibrio sp.]MCA1932296.1 bifunctional hydroxymethylpyrimidine kinase/phosphomethylpyrimidine kinase [Calditerrivibrio sp.]MCA1981254.1 bifunctional hydroxymethylpyrimidine kinase/phosphomethylpyrimidine kinase [Calditerrivibrio sp.]
MKQVLTIAGSDSGAGAGIQADLKAMAANGVYGISVITSITAQNTMGVTDIFDLPLSIIFSQIDTVFNDFDISAVKIGMLSNEEIIGVVADRMRKYNVKRLIVDPVMVAKGGSKLLQDNAIDKLKNLLVPIAYLITPNIEEAKVLVDIDKIENIDDMKVACKKLKKLGSRNVLLKGGHLDGELTYDVLYDGKNFDIFYMQRINTKNTHGTGCTMASTIAANIAKGDTLSESVRKAKGYVYNAILSGKDMNIGKGHGPLNHFFLK